MAGLSLDLPEANYKTFVNISGVLWLERPLEVGTIQEGFIWEISYGREICREPLYTFNSLYTLATVMYVEGLQMLVGVYKLIQPGLFGNSKALLPRN